MERLLKINDLKKRELQGHFDMHHLTTQTSYNIVMFFKSILHFQKYCKLD